MEKDKSSMHASGGGLPPPASRYIAFGPISNSFFSPKSEASSSCAQPDCGRFSHDISQMPDYPPRNTGHRRAQSEILSLPDDISFDSDLGVVGAGEGPSLSDDTEEDLLSMYLDMDKLASSSAISGLDLSGTEAAPVSTPAPALAVNVASSSSEKPRSRHQHSVSMDDSSSIKPEALTSGAEGMSMTEAKKAVSAAKLADLALIDPKRAKRIWANRQSAARSKERKMRYIQELERKVQTLQTEATTLSAQLTVLQRDNIGLSTENSELKLRLQAMEQQVHLQDALNDTLRDEVQRLKIVTGQGIPNGGPMMSFGQSSFGKAKQFYPQNHAMQSLLAVQQMQNLQIHSQHQQQMMPLQQHKSQMQPQQSSTDLNMRGTMISQGQREKSPSEKD